MKIQGVRRINIAGEFIRLDALLKYAAVTSTGGEAKIMIQNGDVYVNHVCCISRGKKIKPGDIIAYKNKIFVVFRDKNTPAHENAGPLTTV